MNEIIIHNQQEMDAISDDYIGKIIIEGRNIVVKGTKAVELHDNASAYLYESVKVELYDDSSAKLYNDAIANLYDRSSAELYDFANGALYDKSRAALYDGSDGTLYDKSSAELHDHASVVVYDDANAYLFGRTTAMLYGNASAELYNNTEATLYGKTSVRLCHHSTAHLQGESNAEMCDYATARLEGHAIAYLRDNAKAFLHSEAIGYLYGDATAELYDSATCELHGNAQVLDDSKSHNITLYGNSRVIYHPRDIKEYLDYYGISHNEVTATLYKAVRKTTEGKYVSNHDKRFEYIIGEDKTEKCNDDITQICSSGIHIAPLNWALEYGEQWSNLAILEVEVSLNDIVLPKYTDGKIRTSKVRVVREVPLEECGILGKIMTRKRDVLARIFEGE